MIRVSSAVLFIAVTLHVHAQSLPDLGAPPVMPSLTGSTAVLIGDVDADGFPDFAASSSIGGGVQLVSGGTGQLVRALDMTADGLSASIEPRVLPIEDIDGDGVADYVLTPAATAPGAATIFSIRSGMTGAVLFALASGGSRGEIMESSLSVVEGIGTAASDLLVLVRETSAFPGASSRIDLHRYAGNDGSLLSAILGYPGIDPSEMTSIGDVNFDGVEDLLVAIPDLSLQQPGSGVVTIISGVNGAIIRNWSGTEVNEGFGSRIEALEDLDGDGRRDFLVLSDSSDEAFPDGGEVQIFSSGLPGRLVQILPPPSQTAIDVACSSDLDGDGLRDFSVTFADSAGARCQSYYSSANGSLLGSAIQVSNPVIAAESQEWGVPDVNGDDMGDLFRIEPSSVTPTQLRLSYRTFLGAQTYGFAVLNLSASWESGPILPRIGRFVVSNASPGAALFIALSSAPDNSIFLIGAQAFPLNISVAGLLLTQTTTANLQGELRAVLNLGVPALAGTVLYIQAAEQSPNLAVSNGLALLFGP